MAMPRDPGTLSLVRARLSEPASSVHLVGIGGVGMAGLARLLLHAGHRVSGSEKQPNRLTAWLAEQGVVVHAGHAAAHVSAGVRLVIRTPAVADDNPELLRAREMAVPVAFRGEALPVVCEPRRLVGVSGTHGKTTTSSMIAGLFRHAGLAPGWCIGGEAPGLDAVAAPGGSAWMVCECDESDGTLVHYRPEIGLVTNIEFDHMEHFSGEEEMFACFQTFARRAGSLVVCADDARALPLAQGHARALTYGFAPGADVRGIVLAENAASIRARVLVAGREQGELHLDVGGRHNLVNALGALTAGITAGLDPAALLSFFSTFRSVARRFQWLVRTGPVQVVSDYAHHPTEIRTVIEVARRTGRRLVAVFQPHRYTRTKLLGPEFPPAFEGLDHLVLAPVYAASEPELEGGRSEDLFAAIQARGGLSCELARDLSDAWLRLREKLRPGDLLLVIGAGDVDRLATEAARHHAGFVNPDA